MKKMRKYKVIAVALLGLLSSINSKAQDSARNELVLTMGYHMIYNNAVYVTANTKAKIETKFRQIPGIAVRVYLNSEEDSNFIAKVVTDHKGQARAILPPALKEIWQSSASHSLLGISEETKEYESTTSETEIVKSKINLDTTSDGETRTITVTVEGQKEGEWIPAADVEMKIGIRRLGGILTAGDAETYTTDSSGTVSVELIRDSLPGDIKGNLVLVAEVIDNEPYGNLLIEKTVPWGVAQQPDKNFFQQRTLWSTRFRTPPWLLLIAYSIVIGVWGTIIYLVVQIVKINKLGVSSNTTSQQGI